MILFQDQRQGELMKKILVCCLATLSFSALADYHHDHRYTKWQRMEMERMPAAMEGVRNMFEFNVDSALRGAFAFDNSKVKGEDATNDARSDLSLNYAYGIARLFQLGARVNYFSGKSGANDYENFDLSVGGIFNSEEDFSRSTYVSLYLGAGWAEEFGPNTRDELQFATLAVGKRIPLEVLGIKHLSYSPEVALKNVSSTTGNALDHSQSMQFRFLQFSVLF